MSDDSQLEEALNETVDTITKACEVKAQSGKIGTMVSENVKQFWKERYRPKFKEAIDHGRVWSKDRKAVLERAKQVGVLAAYIALLVAIFEELRRAGIDSKPGQDITLDALGFPDIETTAAELASKFIDCDGKRQKRDGGEEVQWVWCLPPPDNKDIREILALVTPYGQNTR
jgi:hypothetical protein